MALSRVYGHVGDFKGSTPIISPYGYECSLWKCPKSTYVMLTFYTSRVSTALAWKVSHFLI